MGWDACLHEPNWLLRWTECHPAFGGYLQAAGVVLALIGSALFTWWSLAPSRTERRGRARVIIYRLLPSVRDICATCVRVRRAFDQSEAGMLLATTNRLEEAVRYFTIDAPLPDDTLPELHVLNDELAHEIAQLHYYLAAYNEFIRMNVPLLRSFDGDARGRFIDTFDDLFGAVESLANNSFGMLQQARPKTTDRIAAAARSRYCGPRPTD